MSSSQKQHYRWGLDQNLAKFKRIYGRASGLCRKTKTDDLKISVKPELATKISDMEISDVRQKMGAVNYESVIISGKVSKGGLHSILFDNINNKGKKQILGVILDTCSHFIRKRSRNSRYITFSSGLNEPGSFNQNENCETCISDGGHSSFSGFRFKKINISFAALLVFAMCFLVSCGDSAKQVTGGDSVSNFGKLGGECYPNETCDKGLLCDTENNICIEDPDNPTDTEQNEHDNNHDINDNQWEQPDENHQDTPDNQEHPDNQWEQPDENHNETPDNQWEQPDQDHNENPDNQWEQPDENHQENPDEQNNEGKCDPGYVWVDFDHEPNLSNYEDFVDKQCVSCSTTPTLVQYLEGRNRYCPGGDDLKGKTIKQQMARCPQYTYANDDYSDCVCPYGVPPPGKECNPDGYSTGGDDPNIQEHQCGETTEYQDDQEKCAPGYFWADYSIDSWLYLNSTMGINDGKYYNNQCAPCISVKWATKYMYDTNYYCPGGYVSDLKHKSIQRQVEKCPDYTYVNSDLSACCP